MLVYELESYPEDDLDELARLWSALEIRSEVEQGVAILDYLDVDENLMTGFLNVFLTYDLFF